MDVYVNKVTAPYGGGLAVVAANSVIKNTFTFR